MKVIVVGGGASGIIAAIKASEKADVTIIEGNTKLGKKLLITGNGKCNFWNSNIKKSNYNTEAGELLDNILTKKDEVFNFLVNTLGITPTSKGELIYPYSKTASSVVTTLSREIEKRNIDVLYGIKVNSIVEDNNNITLNLNDGTTIKADKAILACGSKSASKTGSDGSGYKIIKDLGINIDEVTPSLVPLITDDEETSLWSGVRTDAKISLYKENELIKEEKGEIQLTDYGISGIVTFNISRYIPEYLRNKIDFHVSIDFLPGVDDVYKFLDDKNNNTKQNTIEELFETIFNYKLLHALLKKSRINKNASWNSLTKEEKDVLIQTIKSFKPSIVGTEDFEKSQVCHGGVSIDEIDTNFSLKKHKNIKVVGELLNVDGDCGGYNLAFAFISGYIGGSTIND